MTKHDLLTEDEFDQFVPDKRTLSHIDTYRKENRLRKEEMHILDWGCGRGREVLWLREEGYDAYGVDVANGTISNGLVLFKAKGYDGSTLRLLSSNGKTDFPDGKFHFIFSNQVFEHVRDIESIAAEIGRLTINGGNGFHSFPAHRYIVEGHLFMPFIHWLPKNRLRKYLIAIYVALGKEPHWTQLAEIPRKEKVDAYYQYSIDKTYYRKYSTLKKIFQKNGFLVTFETIHENSRYYGNLANKAVCKFFIDYLMLNFTNVRMLMKKDMGEQGSKISG